MSDLVKKVQYLYEFLELNSVDIPYGERALIKVLYDDIDPMEDSFVEDLYLSMDEVEDTVNRLYSEYA